MIGKSPLQTFIVYLELHKNVLFKQPPKIVVTVFEIPQN